MRGGRRLRAREERLRELFETHAGRVFAYAARRATLEEAEDVVGDTFLVAWRRLEDVPDDATAWLLAVAKRVLANRQRSERRSAALRDRLAAQPSSEEQDAVDRIGDRSAVLTALSRLKEHEREALILVAWDGLSVKAAAAVAGCSPGAFAVRLHRARRRLRGELRCSQSPVRGRDGSVAVPMSGDLRTGDERWVETT